MNKSDRNYRKINYSHLCDIPLRTNINPQLEKQTFSSHSVDLQSKRLTASTVVKQKLF